MIQSTSMVHFEIRSPVDAPDDLEKQQIAGFIEQVAGEDGPPARAVAEAVDHAVTPFPNKGGFIMIARENRQLLGVAVIVKTNMESFFPEHLLMYLVVAKPARGQGLGSELMRRAVSFARGEIAVYPGREGAATSLYERFGFTQRRCLMVKTNSSG